MLFVLDNMASRRKRRTCNWSESSTNTIQLSPPKTEIKTSNQFSVLQISRPKEEKKSVHPPNASKNGHDAATKSDKSKDITKDIMYNEYNEALVKIKNMEDREKTLLFNIQVLQKSQERYRLDVDLINTRLVELQRILDMSENQAPLLKRHINALEDEKKQLDIHYQVKLGNQDKIIDDLDNVIDHLSTLMSLIQCSQCRRKSVLNSIKNDDLKSDFKSYDFNNSSIVSQEMRDLFQFCTSATSTSSTPQCSCDAMRARFKNVNWSKESKQIKEDTDAQLYEEVLKSPVWKFDDRPNSGYNAYDECSTILLESAWQAWCDDVPDSKSEFVLPATNQNHFSYNIDFITMTQTNTETKKTRRILRQGLQQVTRFKFGTLREGLVDPFNMTNDKITEPSPSLPKFQLPKNVIPASALEMQRRYLDLDSRYQAVANNFVLQMSTAGIACAVLAIEEFHNPANIIQYQTKKTTLKNQVEEFGYHGTHDTDYLLVAKQGLDPRVTTRKDLYLGAGIYTSTAPDYCHLRDYSHSVKSHPSMNSRKDTHQVLLLLRTLPGDCYVTHVKNPDLRRPPSKLSKDLYDSTRGSWDGTIMTCFYDISQCLVEYAIHYEIIDPHSEDNEEDEEKEDEENGQV